MVNFKKLCTTRNLEVMVVCQDIRARMMAVIQESCEGLHFGLGAKGARREDDALDLRDIDESAEDRGNWTRK